MHVGRVPRCWALLTIGAGEALRGDQPGPGSAEGGRPCLLCCTVGMLTTSSTSFRRLLRLLPLLALLAVALPACGGDDKPADLPNATVRDDAPPAQAAGPAPSTAKQPKSMPPQPATPPATPPGPAPETVLVTVNGQPITQGEVDAEITRSVFRGRPAPAAQMPMVRQHYGAQAEKLLVERKLLEAAVVDEGMTATPEELAERWKLIDARNAQHAPREKILKDLGMTQADADSEIALGIKLEKLLEKHAPAGDVSDEALAAHYEANVQRFATPEQVRARHILLKFEPKMTDEQKAEMKQKLSEIRAEVMKEGGKDFAALAGEHSACPSGKQGGDLGFFGRGQMVPEFDKLAFDLEPGVVSEPFLTSSGYHILEVVEKRPARTKPLEEVKEQLKRELTVDTRQKAQAAYIAKLREKATIERPGKQQ